MSMPLAPLEFQQALDLIANVSDKTVLAPSVKQITADYVETMTGLQKAIRQKSSKVVAREEKTTNGEIL